MKVCPFCKAEILDEAVYCVHCKNNLTNMPEQPEQQKKDKKICPVCGNECHKDAVICVKCGRSFSNTKLPLKKNNKKAITTFLQALAIILWGAGFCYFDIRFLYYQGANIDTLSRLLPALLVFVGLFLQLFKKNPLPSIGLAAYGIRYLVVAVSCVGDGNYLGMLLCFIFAAALIMIALSLLGVFPKKLWFIPAILLTLYCIFQCFDFIWRYSYSIGILFSDICYYIIPIVWGWIICFLSKKCSFRKSDKNTLH